MRAQGWGAHRSTSSRSFGVPALAPRVPEVSGPERAAPPALAWDAPDPAAAPPRAPPGFRLAARARRTKSVCRYEPEARREAQRRGTATRRAAQRVRALRSHATSRTFSTQSLKLTLEALNSARSSDTDSASKPSIDAMWKQTMRALFAEEPAVGGLEQSAGDALPTSARHTQLLARCSIQPRRGHARGRRMRGGGRFWGGAETEKSALPGPAGGHE